MQIICRGRNTGKTTELVRLSAQNNIPILCAGMTNIYVRELAKKMNLSIPKPIWFDEIKEKNIEKIYVDELIAISERMWKVKIEGATISQNS